MMRRALPGILAALALPAHAAILTEGDFYGELPVVLSVSKMVQPLQDSPSAVTVITQDMIQASGFNDIPELLRLVPGFSVAYTRDNTWAVGYHGFADAYSRRLQVQVDGRSIYSPHFGEVGWGMLPLALDDIERIEVVRGPDAAVYGANAFFAIVNIITKHPSQTKGKMASLLVGEQNTAGAVLRYGGEKGDLQYRITLSDQHRDRFEKTFSDDRDGSKGKYYERTYTRFINGSWDYRLSNTDQLTGQIGLTGGDWNAGRDKDPLESRSYEPWSGFAQLRFSRVLNADEEWYVQLNHSYADNGKSRLEGETDLIAKVGSKRYTYTDDVYAYLNLKQWRTQLEFSSTRRLRPDMRLVLSGEVRYEAVEGFGYYDTNSKMDGILGNLFTYAEWKPSEDWLIQGGSQFGYHYFTGLEIAPRLAVSYRPTPHNTLRFAVSRATRAPTFFEEKGNVSYLNSSGILVDDDVTPSKGLDPEVNTSVEVGYLGQWPEWGAQADVRVYRDHVTDYIGLTSHNAYRMFPADESPHNIYSFRDKYFQFVNGGTLDITGADLQLAWKPHRDVTLHLTQSWANIDPSNDTVDDDMAESTPDWITSLLATWKITPNLSLSGFIYYTDKMMWLTEGDITQGYTRGDVKLAQKFKLDGNPAEWAVGVQGIGNNSTEFRRENAFTQRAYATLKLSW